MAKLGEFDRERIRRAFAAGGCDDLPRFVEHQAALHGVSERTVRRALAVHLGVRRTRNPRPVMPGTLQDEGTVIPLVALKAQLGYSTPEIRDIWLANTGELLPSASTINRRLRSLGLAPDKIRRMQRKSGLVRPLDHVRLEAKKSNQTWQLDFSRAEQFYIDKDGAAQTYDSLSYNKNKKHPDKEPLWLYSVVDDHSRVVFAWFYSGNLRSENVLDFLIKAMSRKGPELLADQPGAPAWLRTGCLAPPPSDDRLEWLSPASFPFCGVMEIILTDNDVVLKSDRTIVKIAVTRRLSKKIIHHVPGHSNVKGKVENSFHILAGFQRATKAGAFPSLYEANRQLLDFLIALNTRRNAFQKWINGLQGGLQVLDRPELVRRLNLRLIRRTLDNFCGFSYNGVRIDLPREEQLRTRVGDELEVLLASNYQPGDEVAVILDGVETWFQPVSSAPVDTGVEYRGLAKTEPMRRLEAAQAADLSTLRLAGFYHELPQYRREYELPVGESYRPETLQPVKGAPRSLLYAVKRFQEEGMFARPVTEPEKTWLRTALFVHREEVYDAELEDFVRSVKRGELSVGDNVAVFAGEK